MDHPQAVPSSPGVASSPAQPHHRADAEHHRGERRPAARVRGAAGRQATGRPAGSGRRAAADIHPGPGGVYEYRQGLGRVRLQVRSTAPAAEARTATSRAVYVHGLGGSRGNWSALMEHLADEAVGQAVDLPGFGASPPPDDGDFSVTGHARAVAAFIARGGTTPVHLLGNSLGGAVATRVAALRPDLVRTLTLVSPALPDLKLTSANAPIALMSLPAVGSVLTKAFSQHSVEDRVRRVLVACYGDPDRLSEEVLAAAVEAARLHDVLPYASDALMLSARGLVSEYFRAGKGALWRQAATVRAPTLLIYGQRDRLVDARKAAKAWRTYQDARLLSLPRAGHVAMMEYPETLASAIARFWRDTASGRGGASAPEGATGRGLGAGASADHGAGVDDRALPRPGRA